MTHFETYKHNGHNTLIQITISDFNEFNQLDFNDCKLIYNITQLKIKPLQKIILNKSLDFNGLKFFVLDFKLSGITIILILSNLKGIDFHLYHLNNFKSLSKDFDQRLQIQWELEQSNFDFYLNNNIIDLAMCNFDLLFPMVTPQSSFLSGIQFLFLDKNMIYSEQTCPFLFHNAKIQVLLIGSIKSSFINKNVFAFATQIPFKEKIVSSVLKLTINVYHIEITARLLDEHVFKNLNLLLHKKIKKKC